MTERLRRAAWRAWACHRGDVLGRGGLSSHPDAPETAPPETWAELEAALREADEQAGALTYELERTLTFEAAHFLPKVQEGHRCGRMHGHSYRLTVGVTGRMNPALGWIEDLGLVGDALGRLVVDRLDHRLLNEVEGLENPTSENLGAWALTVLAAAPFDVRWVRVAETCRSSVTVRRG